MKAMTQKRIALLFIAILFILALIPAFYPVEDDTLSGETPFYKSYCQLFAIVNPHYDCGIKLIWARTYSPSLAVADLPLPLPASPETRAPPA